MHAKSTIPVHGKRVATIALLTPRLRFADASLTPSLDDETGSRRDVVSFDNVVIYFIRKKGLFKVNLKAEGLETLKIARTTSITACIRSRN